MTTPITRREILASLSALGLIGAPGAWAQDGTLALGPANPFSFDALVATARQSALAPYVNPARATEILEQMNYDVFAQIEVRRDRTLNLGGGAAQVRMFHLHQWAQLPVGIYAVEGDTAREVLFSRDFFNIPEGHIARTLPEDIGFAGFRVLNPGRESDWLAFMGASYFRTSDPMDQYGISARALAVDTAIVGPEEFPRFTDFFLSATEDGAVTVHALIDSPRVTGAFRIEIARGDRSTGTVMTCSARFFARADMGRVGLAPLTSMFWYSETNNRQGPDWRPEIHDSDGLAIWTGTGERLWRPLNNPHRVVVSSFADTGPRGFGLCQRDRDFERYQDDGIFYEKRPTLWVEPLGDWGPGQVQLVEIPTIDEVHDNIVAYWISDKPVRQGDAIAIDYRLHWVVDEPMPGNLARTYSTRTGHGGVPGLTRPAGVVKFVVDFVGGEIAKYGQGDGVEIVVTTSTGTVRNPYALPVVGTDRWRAVFDFYADSHDTVELRMFLRRGDTALTETWAAQHHPTQIVRG